MNKFTFRRRKSDIERFERAKKVISNLTNPLLIQTVQKVIDNYNTNSEIINIFVNHPNLQVTDNKNSKDGKMFSLEVMLIVQDTNGKYYPKQTKLTCQLVGENYSDKRLNIGKDYHYIHIATNLRTIDYWNDKYKPFLLIQLKNQNQLEEICNQLNYMGENYFSL